MASSETLAKLKPKQLEEKVRALLASSLDDRTLLKELEPLARHWAFGGLTLSWAPPLFRRDPVLFRPFLLAHMSSHTLFKPLKWTGELTTWLAEVEAIHIACAFDLKVQERRGHGGAGLAHRHDNRNALRAVTCARPLPARDRGRARASARPPRS